MNSEREIIFGADLRLLERAGTMDLVEDRAGDLALAAGNENIIQALKMRLMVRQGELTRLGWPQYGSRLHEMIGEPNNQRTHTVLLGHARTAIELDPRVKKVASVTARVLAGERDVVRLDMEIQLISQNNPLNLVFDVRLGAR
jgi:phage baseplate assembly protein W